MSCQWPDKQRHTSRGAALAAIAALEHAGKGSPDMSAYPCGDHWHIGHDLMRFRRRIRRALKDGRRAAAAARRRRTR